MKTKIIFVVIVSFFLISSSGFAFNWGKIEKDAKEALGGKKALSQDEVIRGLKEALSIGSSNATNIASQVDGFYKNPKIMIPFPAEAQKVKDLAETLGLKSEVDQFVMTLNRAAEEAAKQAAPIFLNAIKTLTIQDGVQILKGPNDAATSYLRKKTSTALTTKFHPIVKSAIDRVQVTRYWNPIITKYDAIPGMSPVNPDLVAYVNERALSGLFKLVASEEAKIRTNPAARVTDLLKKVFAK